jgi:hypothetical protein
MSGLQIYILVAPLLLALIGWLAYGGIVWGDRKHPRAK